MTEEKRSAPRINRRFILRAAIFGDEPLRWSYVTIQNLSSTGARFTFDKPVRVGSLLYFKIDFPDRVVQCMGRVRRLAGPRESFHDVGASFEGIEPADRDYIDKVVQQSASV